MSHSPEPWDVAPGNHRQLFDKDENYIGETAHLETSFDTAVANAQRIVAAVNFCKEFSTEFLKAHQLVYLHDESDVRATETTGFVAAKMLPVKASSPASK